MTNPAPDSFDETAISIAELGDIRKRRALLGIEGASLDAADPLHRKLCGLAFSGGGIRSASFALGVSQALARRGVLGRFDYLSTVSGGGYFGSALCSLIGSTSDSRAGRGPLQQRPASALHEDFPFRLGSGTPEPDALTALRSNCDYLTPGGSVGTMRLAGVLVRGVVLNVFLFLPWMLAGVVLTALTFEIEARLGLGHVARSVTTWIVAATLLMMFTFPFVARFTSGSGSWNWRNRHELTLAAALAASLAAIVLLPFNFLVREVIESTWTTVWHDVTRWFALVDRPRVWIIVVLLSIAWLMLQSRLGWARRATSIASRAFLLMLGPSLLLGTYLLLCARFVHPPFVITHVPESSAAAIADSLSAGVVPSTLRARVNEGLQDEGSALSPRARVTELPDAPGRWIVDSLHAAERGIEFLLAPTNGPDGSGLVSRFPLTSTSDSAGGTHLTVTLRRYPEPRDLLILAAFLVVVLINSRTVDVNITSLHQFYRDRISRAFLMKRAGERLEFNDLQRTSDLNPSGIAPYHLANATVNVSGSSDPSARGRKADFFLFSKHAVGSRSTGYCATTDIEAADRRLDYASVAAISGAAAGPRMGVATNTFAAGDLTLFNLRLGYWLPHPARAAADRLKYSMSGPGPGYLLRESFGLLNARGRYVNVSDGGHIENLGVYELLRRRCKVIVAVDAESDPTLDCDAVATLIRYARIDLGITIDIDLSPIRDHDGGTSRAHWAVGRIHYGPDSDDTGTLFYLKSSLTGDENEYINAFRRRFPAFPQQSTADQFFDETRFETYRALGDHIASVALQNGGPLWELLDDYVEQSAVTLTPASIAPMSVVA